MRTSRLALALGVAMSLAHTSPASAAVTCTHGGGVLTADVSPPETFLAFVVNAGAIQVITDTGPVPCGDPAAPPSVSNTDTIRASSSSPSTAVFVDMTGGPFAPGMTAEPDGTSEIEFEINLSASSDRDPVAELDLIVALGTGGADAITTAVAPAPLSQGMNLNGAEPVGDLDVLAIGAEIFGVSGLGGNDRVTGSSATIFEAFFGGPGRDRLAGGAGFDLLGGQSGNDRLSGGPGRDNMDGGPGKDRCSGGPGRDASKGCEKGSDRNVRRQPSRSNMIARFTSWIA